jgi:hypothetical protein
MTSGRKIPTLAPADQQALDALIDAGLDPASVPAPLQPRADKIANLLATLDHLPDHPAPDLLTAKTLAAIERARQQDRFSQQIEALARGSTGLGPGISLRDLAAAAAVLLISFSLLWPLLSSQRGTARQIACQANLGLAGRAFASYAADHNGAMPATQARLGDPWWITGDADPQGNARSNSAHFFVLIRNGYIPLASVRCADNPAAPIHLPASARDFPSYAAVSFSYQNQYTAHKPRITTGPVIAILADKNPFFEPGKYRIELRPDTNSANHTSRGQNVLTTDGQVAWLSNPTLTTGDNIFHAGDEGLDNYTGREAPADERDSFLVP